MKLVYICSPLRGDVANNVLRAKQYCDYAARCGVIPIAPHVAWDGIFDDSIPERRETALNLGLELLKRCDEVWVMGNEISEGMRGEIEAAGSLKIPAVYVLDEVVDNDMKVRQEHAPLGREDCVEASDELDYRGKILVVDPEALKPQYRLSENSLWVASHGPGCMAGKHDRTVHVASLFTGETATFGRYEFFGVVKPERLSQWLQDTPIRNELAAEVAAQATTPDLEPDLDYPYLVGYANDEAVLLYPAAENLASFIYQRGIEGNKVLITTPMDQPFISTFGPYLDKCADFEYMETKLKPALISMQMGDVEPPPIVEVPDNSETKEYQPEEDEVMF